MINGNKLTYFEFYNQFSSHKIFSVNDIRKSFPAFDFNRLPEWQKKGYIKKIVNRWYIFSEVDINEPLLYRISNIIYRPSYISLESALAFYHLIPEGVYTQKAISTRKTKEVNTVTGKFTYNNIKPQLFFGYSIKHAAGFPILIAEPEKAILDYLFFNSAIKNKEDILSLRINLFQFRELVIQDKLTRYASLFDSATLNRKLKLLIKIIKDVDA